MILATDSKRKGPGLLDLGWSYLKTALAVPIQSRWQTAAIVVICLLLSDVASSHEASQHGFRLVPFNRPISAPDFTLKDLTGNSVELKQFRGEIIVLNFWATWCPPCIKEMPSMDRLQQHFKAEPFRVVAVSLDKEPSHTVESFVSALKLNFTILIDPDGLASDPYGAKNLPSTFIVDKSGHVIAAAKGERDWYSPGAISYIAELLEQ